MSAVKDLALGLGEQLASIERELGMIAGQVMQAAILGQPAVADAAQQATDRLDDMVTALSVDLRRFRKALRS